jgi:transcriptional regulator with XRE-family HTH domain
VESSSRLRTRFGKQVRDLRKSQGLSQARLAELLRDKGFNAAHPSTVAKVEGGDRATTLDEVAAYAAVFGVSIDLLLGQPKGDGDVARVVRRLAQTALMGQWQASSVEAELREAVAVLNSHEHLATLVAEAEKAAHALAAAAAACEAVGSGPLRVRRVEVTRAIPREDEDK